MSASPTRSVRTSMASAQLSPDRIETLAPSRIIGALVFLVCLALLGVPGSVRAAAQPDWLSEETIHRLFPDAISTSPPSGEPPVVEVQGVGKRIGYLFSTLELTDVVGFSGAPFNFVVGLDLNGEIVGVVLVEHAEPIIDYSSLGEELMRFIAQYTGLDPGGAITFSGQGTTGDIDGISSATVSARAFHHAIVQSARMVARSRGLLTGAGSTAMVNMSSFEPLTWPELVAAGAIERIDIRDAGNAGTDSRDTALELYAAVLNPTSIGRNLLGPMRYGEYVTGHSPQDLIVLLMGLGSYSFVGTRVFETGTFDRIRIEQAGRSFVLERTPEYYRILPFVIAKGAPKFDEIGLFRIPAQSGIDVLAPWKVVLIVGDDAGSGAQTREFELSYTLPSRFVLPPVAPSAVEPLDAPWRESWRAQANNIVVLTCALLVLTVLLVAMHRLTRHARLYEALRVGFLLFTLVWIGWIAGAQLSIINVFAWLHGLFSGHGLAVLLADPLLLRVAGVRCGELRNLGTRCVLRLAVPVRRTSRTFGQACPSRQDAPVVAVAPDSPCVVALEVRVARDAGRRLPLRTADHGGRGGDRAVQDRHLAENGSSLAIRGVRTGAARRRLVRRTGVLSVSLPAWRGDGDWRQAAPAPVHAIEAPPGMRQPLPAVRKALSDTGHRAKRGDQHGRMLLLPRLPGHPQRCDGVSAAGA